MRVDHGVAGDQEHEHGFFGFGRKRNLLAFGQRHIKDTRGNMPRKDAAHAAESAGKHANLRATHLDNRDHFLCDTKVGGLCHLLFFRQIQPKLEAKHSFGSLWHLLMKNSAAGRHPLTLAGVDCAAVAEAVHVFNLAADEVGDRLDPSVRMPRKSRGIIVWIGGIEGIQHQKRIEVIYVAIADDANERYARAVHRALTANGLHDFTLFQISLTLLFVFSNSPCDHENR